MNNKTYIFVLGDSRTGTTSIGEFLKRLGYSSIHYYVDETNHKNPLNRHREGNWIRLKHFIINSEYTAYSDYPTRLYFKELDQEFKNAKFILSHRQDSITWLNSMKKYFHGRNLQFDALLKNYETLNAQIRKHFEPYNDKLLEICIEDGSKINSQKIKIFLNIDSDAEIFHLNQS